MVNTLHKSYLQWIKKWCYYCNSFCPIWASTSDNEERCSFRTVHIGILHCGVNVVQVQERKCVPNGSVEGTLWRSMHSKGNNIIIIIISLHQPRAWTSTGTRAVTDVRTPVHSTAHPHSLRTSTHDMHLTLPLRRTLFAECSIPGVCRCRRWSAERLDPLQGGRRPSAARRCWRTDRSAGPPSHRCHTRRPRRQGSEGRRRERIAPVDNIVPFCYKKLFLAYKRHCLVYIHN